jgi:hypothetical protein
MRRLAGSQRLENFPAKHQASAFVEQACSLLSFRTSHRTGTFFSPSIDGAFNELLRLSSVLFSDSGNFGLLIIRSRLGRTAQGYSQVSGGASFVMPLTSDRSQARPGRASDNWLWIL